MPWGRFEQQIQEAWRRLEVLQADAETGLVERESLLVAVFQEMETAYEELSAAEEELRQQSEALVDAHDASEQWRRHYQELFELAPDGYLVTDLNGVIQDANRAAALLLELEQKFLVGKPLVSFVPEEARRMFRRELTQLVQTRQARERELWLQPRRGPLFDAALTVAVVTDPQGAPTALRWLIRDITQRHEAEADRYRRLVEEIRDYAIFLMDPQRRVLSWNSGAEQILGYMEEEMRGRSADIIFTPEEREAGAPETEARKAATDGRAEDERWHVRKDGTRFFASGIMTALRDTAGHLRFFAKIMRDITARKEAEEQLSADYEREHRIAEAFQRALLQVVPEDAFPGLAVVPFYEAAWQEALVGGDFYDAFALEEGRVALVVGDISGKGLRAAVRAAEVKSALRAFLREYPYPARALSRLNGFVADSHRFDGEDNAFVTLALVVVELATGAATVAAAGAEPPLILRAGGAAEAVDATGKLLGVDPQEEYEAATLHLAPGDMILLVTDGITEARRGREFLDYGGLIALAQEARRRGSLRGIGQAIMDGARAFARGALSDDACLLLARRE